MSATNAAELYTAETEFIAGLGLPVLEPVEIDQLAGTELGQYLLAKMATAAWDVASAQRAMSTSAEAAKSYAEGVLTSIADGARNDGGWLVSAATKVAESAAERQAKVDEIKSLTYLAKKALAG